MFMLIIEVIEVGLPVVCIPIARLSIVGVFSCNTSLIVFIFPIFHLKNSKAKVINTGVLAADMLIANVIVSHVSQIVKWEMLIDTNWLLNCFHKNLGKKKDIFCKKQDKNNE